MPLVERVFDNPDTIGQGEHTAIYEFLLAPDTRDYPDAIAGVLQEFSGWARHMLEQIEHIHPAKSERPRPDRWDAFVHCSLSHCSL